MILCMCQNPWTQSETWSKLSRVRDCVGGGSSVRAVCPSSGDAEMGRQLCTEARGLGKPTYLPPCFAVNLQLIFKKAHQEISNACKHVCTCNETVCDVMQYPINTQFFHMSRFKKSFTSNGLCLLLLSFNEEHGACRLAGVFLFLTAAEHIQCVSEAPEEPVRGILADAVFHGSCPYLILVAVSLHWAVSLEFRNQKLTADRTLS